ncbi:hypothetical protein YC2023_066383 [Brassica napus]
MSVAVHQTSVGVRQHTQNVRVCPSAHTGRPWLSVCVRVSPSAHTGHSWLSISTHISTLVLGLSMLALLVDCLGDFSPRGLSVQYTQDVCGCPPAHTGRLWLSVTVRQHTQDVRGSPCVSVCVRVHTHDVRGCPSVHISERCTDRTSVGVRQHTQDVRVCPSAHTGRPWVSMCVCQHTQDVCGCPLVHISAHWPFPLTVWVILAHEGCLFSTHRTSVGVRQHTQDVRGSVSTHKTSVAVGVCPCVSVGVRQHTQDVCGCLWLSVSPHRTSVCVRQHTQDVRGCPSVHISARCTHRTIVGVRQHTQDVRGCPSAHTGRPWLSVCVRVCPSAHTGRPWVSTSTHRTSVCVRQHTQDVRGCPPAHTGRLCVSVSTHRTSVAVRVCPYVSVSTHRTSVSVHQYTYQHVGPWTQHAGPSRGLFGWFWPTWAVCSVHTGRPCVSASTHRTSVAVRQHTQDVRCNQQARDLTLGREGTSLASGDRKYFENLRSTIEKHRPCHFRSSTIGGVTKVKHRDKIERVDCAYRCYYHYARVSYPHGRVHYRPVKSQVYTSNTSPDSCVIDVKVGVVCGPIQSDETAHDHLDALILPASQVSSLC